MFILIAIGAMRLFKKEKIVENDRALKTIYCCGIAFYQKKYTLTSQSVSFCGLEFFSKKISQNDICYRIFSFINIKQNFDNLYKNIIKDKRSVILYFDHALGGGTDVYSKCQINQLKRDENVWRIQYLPAKKIFCLTAFTSTKEYANKFWNLSQLKKIALQANVTEIIINNLVSYANSLSVLDFVDEIKKNHKNKITVSMRGHDFQSICVSYNLLNDKGVFCNLPDMKVCEQCSKHFQLNEKIEKHKILLSGMTDIVLWRKRWEIFYRDTVDELIVFSDAVRDIFLKVYPFLQDRIKVIPHKVRSFRQVNIPEHKGINIAFLGNLNSVAKGKNIIKEMAKIAQNPKAASLFVIGSLDGIDGITVTGKYNPDNLPDIVENLKVDIIFIPSVWPETFSYTTAEAMQMNIPVACFDFGAPAERVRKYHKGLVISKLDAKTALDEICNFIHKQKNED